MNASFSILLTDQYLSNEFDFSIVFLVAKRMFMKKMEYQEYKIIAFEPRPKIIWLLVLLVWFFLIGN